MSDWKISKADCLLLIHKYRELECLWNCTKPVYKRTDLKRDAWRQLSIRFGRGVDDLKRKIRYLRTVYVVEKRKVEESKRTASSPEDIYRPRLFYFDEFRFLDPTIIYRKSINNELDTRAEEFEETVDTTTQFMVTPCCAHRSSPSPPESSQIFKKQKIEHISSPPSNCDAPNDAEPIANLIDELPESVYSSFGKTISLQLAQMNTLEATLTMDKIHRLVSRNVLRSLLAKKRRIRNGRMSPISTSAESNENNET